MKRDFRSLKALLDADAVSKWITAFVITDDSEKAKAVAADNVIKRSFPGVSDEVLAGIKKLAYEGMRRAQRLK